MGLSFLRSVLQNKQKQKTTTTTTKWIQIFDLQNGTTGIFKVISLFSSAIFVFLSHFNDFEYTYHSKKKKLSSNVVDKMHCKPATGNRLVFV